MWFAIFFYFFIVCSADDFSRSNGESLENYATRLLARHAYESNDEYEVRVAFLEVLKPNLPIWKNYEYLKYVTVEGNSTSRPPYVPKYLDDLTQKTEENSTQYYRRIFERRSDENNYQYMERVSILRGLLNMHSIWLNKEFMDYVKPHIILNKDRVVLESQAASGYRENLKQRNGESKEDYYTRILTRHTYESNAEFEVRIAFLQPLTPNLPIWKNYEYLKYITVESNHSNHPPYEPKYLEDLVQKKDENSDQYYKRIFERHSDENVYQYMERIAILRGLLKVQNIWMDNNFMTYVKPHILKSLQKKQSSKRTQGGTTSQVYNTNTLTKPLSSSAEDDRRGGNDNLPAPSKQQSSNSVRNGFSNEKGIISPSESEREIDVSDEEDGNEFNGAAAYNKRDDESLKTFCMRVFAKRPFETDSAYRRTVKRMMERWLQFEMWREKCKPHVNLDVLLSFNKYNRLDGESKSAYCRRLFQKRFYETDDKYKGRIAKTKARFLEFDTWQQTCKEYLKSDNLHTSK